MEKIKGYDFKNNRSQPRGRCTASRISFSMPIGNGFSVNRKNIVVLPYISMHGSTKKMVDYLRKLTGAQRCCVEQFDVSGE